MKNKKQYSKKQCSEKGIIMVSVLLSLVLLSALFGAHFVSVKQELGAKKSLNTLSDGFYAAEAGLNVRAENIRNLFQGFALPTGTSPNNTEACQGSNLGSGDFGCQSNTFNNKSVSTYIEDLNGPDGNPQTISIPLGESFGGLTAHEYRYDVRSLARDTKGRPSASLGIRAKSRLVPIFQFFAFYKDDLEIFPANEMNLNGPIYSAASIFLASTNGTLDMSGSITAGNSIYTGRKDTNSCPGGTMNIKDPNDYVTLANCSGGVTALTQKDLEPWNNNITMNAPTVTLPEVQSYEMGPDSTSNTPYWDNADLRIVLALDSSNNLDTTNHSSGVEVRNLDGSYNSSLTNALHSSDCEGPDDRVPAESKDSMTDWQNCGCSSGELIRTLDIDVELLMDCMHDKSMITGGLGENTNGGLVIYTGIDGPDRLGINKYGVRYKKGAKLASSNITAPKPIGLTMVSSQSFYLWGDFNTVNKIPALIVGDRFNVLSNAWTDDKGKVVGDRDIENEDNGDTTYNLAILANTSNTGGANAPGGIGSDINFNGGLQNFTLRHERWHDKHIIFHGAFATLGAPLKSNHPVTFTYVNPPPNRDYSYDEDFYDTSSQPPMSPNFVYLKQEFFVRYFE